MTHSTYTIYFIIKVSNLGGCFGTGFNPGGHYPTGPSGISTNL